MFYQNEPGIDIAIKENGCAFMCALYLGEKYFDKSYNRDDVNSFWDSAVHNLIISGDLNNDGRVSGPNEGVIQNWDRLFQHLGIPLRTMLRTHAGSVTHHFPAAAGVPAGCLGICAWRLDGMQHFVVGTHRPVEYDPWAGGSRTVRHGEPFPDGLRIFQVMK